MMNEQERVDYLILALTANNAKEFARRVGIGTPTLSRLRHGERQLKNYHAKILAAFPQVNEAWLLRGEGDPIRRREEPNYRALIARLGRLEKKLDELIAFMEKCRENG